ncbi:hypothetical protein [Psychromonas ossibalaenae]|uniref:hypothetical protein n=1 Tax=Psychromonas ossibalaenae TaxID=444922 RepID=UPI00036CBE57|nr:hypothetical protein [Psychromonas ossibalaenae]
MEVLILVCCLINPVPDTSNGNISNSIIVNSFNDTEFKVKPICYVVEDEKQCDSEKSKPTQ